MGSFHPKTNDPRFAIAAVSAELGWMGVGESGTVVGGGAAAVGVGPRSFGAPAISVVKMQWSDSFLPISFASERSENNLNH